MEFNRKKFFDGFRAWRGSISQQQVQGLNFLLERIENDRYIQRIDWIAYMLATVFHETAATFHPIHEYGSRNYFIRRYGGQTRKGRELGNDTPEEGASYAGQGYVQLTGESNYEKAEVALRREYPDIIARFESETGKKFDLTVGDQPNDEQDAKNAQNPYIAYAIMSYGMRTGMFTGRKFTDYLRDGVKDYVNARRIINGTDKAEQIARYAREFEKILRAALRTVPNVEREFQNTSDEQIILAENPQNDASPVLPPETESDAEYGANTGTSEKKVTVNNEGISVRTSENTPPPQDVAIVKTQPKNFFRIIWTEVTGLAGGNLTFQALRDYAEQTKLLGLSLNFWFWASLILGMATLIYLVLRYLKYREETKRDLEITNQLIQANSTENNKVVLVDDELIPLYEKQGYHIVTR